MILKNLLSFRKQYYLQINFYINTVCNLQCSYCYARKNLDWNKIIKFDQIKKIIPMLNKLDKSVISLIGGEPTLHPDFLNIMKLLSKTKHDIHFYTNGIPQG
jgi:MoaA/NifB/PqqE/SkfB family radical SAM enzyme